MEHSGLRWPLIRDASMLGRAGTFYSSFSSFGDYIRTYHILMLVDCVLVCFQMISFIFYNSCRLTYCRDSTRFRLIYFNVLIAKVLHGCAVHFIVPLPCCQRDTVSACFTVSGGEMGQQVLELSQLVFHEVFQ